ncbi:hypothetical protein [Micromonospora tulbaghiae]|uniref:hypothetical protein n=1 Tax=Micromonospora tulbaghiae TaxID=479978 RepID=UPI003679E16C
MMDPNSPILRRFPLVARPRPIAKALTARVDDLCALAERAERENDLAAASAVYNQAALIASDCGQPNLARQWCHEHAEAYLPALPLGAQAARHALEPLVNLARLHIRDGNGDAALQLLTDLFHAVSTRTDTSVDNYPLPASRLTRSEHNHREVRQWLWSVLIADGARAMTSAGRWQEAYEHLKRHNGIGQRMLDGRQVAVIALATTGKIEQAETMIDTTIDGEPWEQAVTACLARACVHAVSESDEPTIVLLDRYRRLRPVRSQAVFHVRLGLSVIDAIGACRHADLLNLTDSLITQTIAFEDARVASEVLQHLACAAVMDPIRAEGLAELVTASGHGRGSLPLAILESLSSTTSTAEAVIRRRAASGHGVQA